MENTNDYVKMYAVKCNSDLTEGRGREFIKHICRLRSTAVRLGKNGYVQGSDCPVDEINVIDLGDSKYILPNNYIEVVEPSSIDVEVEQKHAAYQNVLARAKELGLSEQEIEILKKGI